MISSKAGIAGDGSAIMTYDEPDALVFEAVERYGPHLEEITAHVELHYGPVRSVIHEIVSEKVHLDVLTVPPSDSRSFWTFVTCGMSDRSMPVEFEGGEEWAHAELVIALPSDRWKDEPHKVYSEYDEGNEYVVSWLKWLARFPHDYGAWIGPGHTFPAGNPARHIGPDTRANGFFLWRAVSRDMEFDRLIAADGTAINFYGVYLLFGEEMAYKLEKGSDALLGKMKEYEIDEVFHAGRASLLRR